MTEEIIIDGVDVAECKHYCEKIDTGGGFIQRCKGCGYCLHNVTGLKNADIYFRVLSFPECNGQSDCYYKQLKRLEQENKELKEWKEKVVKLFESACRCKYLNEETDICSYTNEKCININKCVCKYQELSDTYRSALEEIKHILEIHKDELEECLHNDIDGMIQNKINEVLNG